MSHDERETPIDLHERWPHRWLTSKAEAFESPTHGIGIRAKKLITQGDLIVVYSGLIVQRNEIDEYREIMGDSGIQIADYFFVVPSSREELKKTGVVNHSCRPNAGFRQQTELVSIEDIQKGDEITFDYAFSESCYFEPFQCHCPHQEECRGIITSDDWKRADIQERYGEYFQPYLKERIAALPK